MGNTKNKVLTVTDSIHAGQYPALMEKSNILRDNVEYIQMIYEFKKEMPKAVGKAINSLPKESDLRKYLLHQKAEVTQMLLTEYDEAKTLRLIARDERELGRQEERGKTEQERQRADKAEERAKKAEERAEKAEERAAKAEERTDHQEQEIIQLKAIVEELSRKLAEK